MSVLLRQPLVAVLSTNHLPWHLSEVFTSWCLNPTLELVCIRRVTSDEGKNFSHLSIKIVYPTLPFKPHTFMLRNYASVKLCSMWFLKLKKQNLYFFLGGGVCVDSWKFTFFSCKHYPFGQKIIRDSITGYFVIHIFA